MTGGKVLLIGWDAADWRMIHPLIEAGKMPNVQRLVENGTMAQIATLHPALSPMLWTSIATGKRPFKHGIHGFSEPTPDGRGVQPVTNLSRTSKAVWNILQQNGLRSNVVGWWPSHPSEPISGVMVSDHFHRASGPLKKGWPLRRGAVHPERLTETMAELRMHPDELAPEMIQAFLPRDAKIKETKDRRLEALCRTLCECVSIHSAATWLLDNEPWDFFAVYYDAIDHFCHGFMKYHPPRQAWVKVEDYELYQGVVSTAYQFHDQMLGTLLRKAGGDTRVILMSDHGFHSDHLRPNAIPDIPAGPAIEHRDFGILVISGNGVRKDALIHGASVLDITPTLLTMFGLPVGQDMDGKVLADAFETPPAVQRIPSWEDVTGDDGRHPPNTRLDPVGAKEALDQLVALGYIDPLDHNAEKAVAGTLRELKYNLCEAYQDASRHPEALDLARELHKECPDEQRFAVKRFVSCQALGFVDEMREIVEDLDGRRRALYQEAVERVQEFRALVKGRSDERKAALDRQDSVELADPTEGEKSQPLLNPEEREEMAKWRGLTRYQAPVIDYLKAQVFTAERQWHAALECLSRVQQAHLVRPGLLLQTAELYGHLNRWDEAERTYTQALEIDPDNPHAHLGLCRVALRRREFAGAAQAALESLRRLYQFPMAHFLLGVALIGTRDFDRAAEALRVAIGINPNFPQAHVRMAWLLKHKLGDSAGAAAHMRLYRETRGRRSATSQYELRERPATDKEQEAPGADHAKPALLPPLGNGVVIVSGLPRSGTSMIMQMLAAGGLPILTDAKRKADEDNPLGYLEFEPVKQPQGYENWIAQAAGKAVKVVAQLVSSLPVGPAYRIIFIERDLDEVLTSQARMIKRRGENLEDTPARRDRLRAEYAKLTEKTKAALRARGDVDLLVLHYSGVMRDADMAAQQMNLYCGGELATAAMTACVKPELHRNRKS